MLAGPGWPGRRWWPPAGWPGPAADASAGATTPSETTVATVALPRRPPGRDRHPGTGPMAFAAFDVTGTDRGGLADLLATWTGRRTS